MNTNITARQNSCHFHPQWNDCYKCLQHLSLSFTIRTPITIPAFPENRFSETYLWSTRSSISTFQTDAKVLLQRAYL